MPSETRFFSFSFLIYELREIALFEDEAEFRSDGIFNFYVTNFVLKKIYMLLVRAGTTIIKYPIWAGFLGQRFDWSLPSKIK